MVCRRCGAGGGGDVRIILAVIASAVAIAILIDSPRRELAAQLEADWQEYREHVGNPSVFGDFRKSAEFSEE